MQWSGEACTVLSEQGHGLIRAYGIAIITSNMCCCPPVTGCCFKICLTAIICRRACARVDQQCVDYCRDGLPFCFAFRCNTLRLFGTLKTTDSMGGWPARQGVKQLDSWSKQPKRPILVGRKHLFLLPVQHVLLQSTPSNNFLSHHRNANTWSVNITINILYNATAMHGY